MVGDGLMVDSLKHENGQIKSGVTRISVAFVIANIALEVASFSHYKPQETRSAKFC